MTEIDNIMQRALTLKTQEKYEEALKLLDHIKTSLNDDPRFLVIYGMILYLQKNYLESAKYFQVLVKLRPSSELVSTSLFQSYWNNGEFELATEELNRFLTSSIPVEAYLTILDEHYHQLDDSAPDKYREVISKFYKQYFNKN